MKTVNRSAIVIKPKEPYLNWANEVGQTMEPLEELRRQSTVLLIPESAYRDDAAAFLRENCARIFERELEAWSPSKRRWPAKLDYETLNAWFEIEVHGLVLDFAEGELSSEPEGL